MKKHPRILVGGMVFVGCFFIVNSASAAFIAGQPIFDTVDGAAAVTVGQDFGVFGQAFRLSRVELYARWDGTGTQPIYKFQIRRIQPGPIQTFFDSESFTLNSEAQVYSADFSSQLGIWTAADEFLVTITRVSGTGQALIYGSSSNVYSGSCYSDGVCTGVADSYFKIYSTYNVSFIIPNSGQTGTDFRNWVIQLSDFPATSTSRRIDILYGGYIDSKNTSISNTGTFQVSIPKTNSLANQLWQVHARVYDNGTLVANSTIYFTISTSTGVNPFIDPTELSNPNATNTISDLDAACDPTSNTFTKSFCYLFYYLIVPSNESYRRFIAIPEYLLDRAPFSYFTDSIILFNELVSTSSLSAVIILNASTTQATAPLNAMATTTFTTIDFSDVVSRYPIISSFRNYLGTIFYVVWGLSVGYLAITLIP